MSRDSPEVSIVPLLNEQDNIRLLYEQIIQTLTDKYNYEMIFTGNGNGDNALPHSVGNTAYRSVSWEKRVA